LLIVSLVSSLIPILLIALAHISLDRYKSSARQSSA
jgi:hypothetical protein